MSTEFKPVDGAKMPAWVSHKVVEGFKILSMHPVPEGTLLIGADGVLVCVDAAWMGKHRATAGGYFVLYEDGYKSFSPADAFEKGYTPAPATPYDVTITLTEVGPNINIEGRINPNKEPGTHSPAALGVTEFIANNFAMLMQLAQAAHAARQQPQPAPQQPPANEAMSLIQSGFKPVQDAPAAIVDVAGQPISSDDEPGLSLVNIATDLLDTSDAPASITGLVSGGGGDFAGAGAQGSWDAPSASASDTSSSSDSGSSDSSSSDTSSSSD